MAGNGQAKEPWHESSTWIALMMFATLGSLAAAVGIALAVTMHHDGLGKSTQIALWAAAVVLTAMGISLKTWLDRPSYCASCSHGWGSHTKNVVKGGPFGEQVEGGICMKNCSCRKFKMAWELEGNGSGGQ